MSPRSRWALLAIVLGAVAASPAAETLTTMLPTAEGEVCIQIEDDREDAAWRRYFAAQVAALIRAYEDYLAVPFVQAAAPYFADQTRPCVRIVGAEVVAVNGQRVGGYNNSAGLFGPDRGIFVEYSLADVGRPALVLHEVGHYFLYQAPWLSEGMVSFLPLATAAAGLLELTAAEQAAVASHWGAQVVVPGEDLPLLNDFRFSRPELFGLWYAKTYKLQALLHQRLGGAGYRCLAIWAADQQAALGAAADRAFSLVSQWLAGRTGADWAPTLSGWVTPGPYLAGATRRDVLGLPLVAGEPSPAGC